MLEEDKRKETYERTFMIYEALLRDMYDRQENLNVKLSEKRANQMYIEHPLSVTHGKQTAVDKILGRKVKDTDVCIGGRLPTGTFKPQVDYAMEEAIRREQFFIKKRQRQLEQIRKIGEDRYRDTNFHERIKTIEQAVYTEMKNRKAAISEMRKRRREYAEKQ